ncbi:MAG: 5'-nucleotidase C-terminal domain-containing protein [Gemmatimonadales bacterium]
MIFRVALSALLLVTKAAAQDTVTVVIAATTDVHGHVMHWDYVKDSIAPWGLTRAATVLDSLRRAHPNRIVLVDAGDLIQGNPFAFYHATAQASGINPIIDALNGMRYDAITLGNHEFNFGVPYLNNVLQEANFPVLAANVFDAVNGTRAYRAYTMVHRGPARVAIAGFTTPGSMIWDRANLSDRLEVRSIMSQAEDVLRAMESAGATVKVVVIHSGMDEPSSYSEAQVGAENVAARFASLSVKPDLVVVGHTHRVMRDSVVNGVHFVQPEAWARSLALAYVTVIDSAGTTTISVRGEQIRLANIDPEPQLTRSMRRSHDATRRWVGAPLAGLRGDWSGQLARAQDTPIIDFVNEVQRRVTGAQLSSTSAFNPSVSFGPDAALLRDIAGIYPYENTLRAVLIDGASLKQYLEQSAAYFRNYEPGSPIIDPNIPGYNYDIVSGVDYTIDLAAPVGHRIRELTFQGRPVTPSHTFTLALNSYRQEGGGGFAMIARLPVVYDRNQNIRELLIQAARSAGVLSADEYYRDSWRIVPPDAAVAVREAFGAAEPTELTELRLLVLGGFERGLQPVSAAWADDHEVGGAAAIKGWMDQLEDECQCATLRLNAGGSLQGNQISDLTFGSAPVDALNAMSLDASAVSTVDLRWNRDTLLIRSAQANYDLLSANAYNQDTQTQAEWSRPWTTFEEAGTRISIVGLTLGARNTVPSRGHFFTTNAVASINQVLPAIRAERPDYIVVLTSGTTSCGSSGCEGEIFELANTLQSSSVDLLLGRGDPPIDTIINGIRVVASGAGGSRLGVVDFRRRRDGSLRVSAQFQTTWVDSIIPDSLVAAVVSRHSDAVAEVLDREVATLRAPLQKHGGEYPLGRLVADAARNTARTRVAIVPNTEILDGLPGGRVTYGDVIRVLSLESEIVRVRVTGVVLRQVIERLLIGEAPLGQLSGLEVRYDPTDPVGRRVKRLSFPDGERISDNQSYTIAVPDIFTDPNYELPFFAGSPTDPVGVSLSESLAAYLGRLPQPVQASRSQRFLID